MIAKLLGHELKRRTLKSEPLPTTLKHKVFVIVSIKCENITDVFKIGVFEKFRHIHKKTAVLDSVFNIVVGLRLKTLLKRDSNSGVFL